MAVTVVERSETESPFHIAATGAFYDPRTRILPANTFVARALRQ